MKTKIFPGKAVGVLTAPPSKSMAHRLLIAAALSDGESVVENLSLCEDVLATVDCLRALGAEIKTVGSTAYIRGFDPRHAESVGVLNCRESGSTLRFLVPLAWLCGKGVKFAGKESLLCRPMSVYEELSDKYNAVFSHTGGGIEVKGPLCANDVTVDAGVSSQFVSGLIFAMIFNDSDSTITLRGDIESLPYIDMTIDALCKFGACVARCDSVIKIKANHLPRARKIRVEGDYSATAFIEAMSLLSGNVKICGLDENSLQGDKVYLEYFPILQRGFSEISIKSCPDLGPILFTFAAACHGGRFTDTARLRIKESDRSRAMKCELEKFGAQVEVYDNEVVINPSVLHTPSEILSGHNDHRIVMSLAVLCTVLGGEISGAEAVSKSYPHFFEDIKSLGIRVEYEN